MTRLLIKQYLRSKGLMIGLLILFGTGLMSIHIGKLFLERQQATIEKTAHSQEEHIQRHLEYTDGHLGLFLYYIRFGLANESPAIAGLSIGHKDIRPAAQLVNIRNLEEQKNTSELLNPFYQLLGNLDFSFVLIYLFPLFIIAINFNLLSEEKESGRWSLLSSQSPKPIKIIQSKFLIRIASVFIILFLSLLTAKFYLKISLDHSFLAFSLSSIFYLLFWFALSWFVTSWNKSSNQNALILLSVWILLTAIIPAVINNLVIYLYPIPEAYEMTIDSRDGYHNKWDEPKEPTISKFKKHYPQFTQYEHPNDQDFSWFWYYAMQQMGDDEAEGARLATNEKLHQRNQFTNLIGIFVPSIHTQLVMNTLCKTDMVNYLNYLDALERFHEGKRLYFYPKIFDNMPIDSENWGDFKLEHFHDQRVVDWLSLLPMLICFCILLVLARLNFNHL